MDHQIKCYKISAEGASTFVIVYTEEWYLEVAVIIS